MLDASLNEVGLVALFVAIVLIASKVGKIGEAVGGLLERGGEESTRTQAGPDKDASKPEGP